jgi:hypothetical protein
VGVAVPELMAQLGVSSWTNVPNPILERWMGADYPPKLRILAALVRQSFGYQSPYCVHLVKGRQRPLRQADLGRLLRLHCRWIKRVWAELRREGCVTVQDRLIYVTPNPPPPPEIRVATDAETGEAISDCEYLAEMAEAKRLYVHEISAAKARLSERLRLARIRAMERAEGANLTPQNGGQLDPHFGAYKRKESEKKGPAGGQYSQPRIEEPAPPASPPAFPSVEVEQLHRYLEQFTHLVGEAPDPAEVAEIHKRLNSASIGQFQTHVDNRLARGWKPRGWRVFRLLAADCAASVEQFAHGPPAERPELQPHQQDLARLQRALGGPR